MLKTIAISAALTAVTFQAQAACNLAQMAGVWTIYNIAELPSHSLAWVTCALGINRAGAIDSKGSLCVNSNGVKLRPEGKLRLAIASACAFTGSLDFPSAGVGGTIESLTLSIDKNYATGIGTGSAGEFLFNMVRIK